MRKLFLSAALCIIVCSGSFGGEMMTLYAVKYGESAYPASQIFKGDKSGKRLPFSWMFYAVTSGSETILIDTGFSDPVIAKNFGVTFLPYQPAMSSAGITPESVTKIVLTHTHFDHAANLPLYPNATVIVNRREMNSPALSKISRSRIIFFDDSYTVISGMTVRHAGGHTAGSSYVELMINGKKIILTGDEAYLPQNVTGCIPVGSFTDTAANIKFLTMAKNSGAEILTFHDPAVIKNGCIRTIAP